MSLDYNLKGIKNWESMCITGTDDCPILQPTTHALIVIMMNIGYTEITKDNWEDVWRRVYIYEKLLGARRKQTFEGNALDLFFRPEQIWAHIGLKTNFGIKSFSEFAYSIMKGPVKDAEQQMWKFKEERDAA